MKRVIVVGSVAACVCLGLAAPLLAADPAVTGTVNQAPPGGKTAASNFLRLRLARHGNAGGAEQC